MSFLYFDLYLVSFFWCSGYDVIMFDQWVVLCTPAKGIKEAQVMSQVCDEEGIKFFGRVSGTCF